MYAKVHLGLSFDEFDELSYEEFALYQEQHQQRELRQVDIANHRAGVIASVIANVHRSKDSKAVQPSDFFKFHTFGQAKSTPKATPEQIAQSQADVLEALLVTARTNRKRKQAEAKKGNGS